MMPAHAVAVKNTNTAMAVNNILSKNKVCNRLLIKMLSIL